MFDLDLNNGTSTSFDLSLFSGAPAIVWGKIKVAGTFVDIISRKYKTGGAFVDAINIKIKMEGIF